MAQTLKSAKLDLYIYTGSQENKGEPKYTLTKTKLASEDTIVFEISELVRDYIDVKFTGNYEKAEMTAWVDTELTRTFSDDDGGADVTDTDPIKKRYIAFRGYGELFDININDNTNVNPTLSKDILISNRTIFHLEGEPLNVPFYLGEDGVFKVEYKNNDSVVSTRKYGGNIKYIKTDNTAITIDNTNRFDTSLTALRSDDNGNFVGDVEITDTVDEIVYTDRKGNQQTIPVKKITECKHIPYRITFLNKFGALQDLWFFKRSDRSFSVEKEDFRKSTIYHSATKTDFNTYDSPSVLLQSTSKKMIVMNTGFVTEDHNHVIKQLLNTEYCWIHEAVGEDLQLKPVPIRPVTMQFNEQLEINDKLLNFTVEFEYSHNYIQDIR